MSDYIMKNVNINGLDKLPHDWEINKIKFTCLHNQNSLSEDTKPDYGFFYLDISNYNKLHELDNNDLIIFANAPSRARRIPKNKDIIISTVRTYLRAISFLDNIPNNLIVSTGFCVISTMEKLYPKFLYYLIISEVFIDNIVANSKGVAYPAINSSDLVNLSIWFPDKSIQFKISHFLDKTVSQIDFIVENLKNQVDILKKYKKSLIIESVTKGLDKSVPMKDSGIDWIGEIPEHWIVSKLKYEIDSLKSGGTPDSSNFEFYDDENGINWVTISDMSENDFVHETKSKLTKLGIKDKNLTIFQENTLLYSIYATIGEVSELLQPATINQAILAIIINENFDKTYLKYQLIAMKDYIVSLTSATTQNNLNAWKVNNFNVVLPSIGEQNKIGSFLENKNQKINEIIEEKEKAIVKIENYKKSLIFEYVTGKKRVK